MPPGTWAGILGLTASPGILWVTVAAPKFWLSAHTPSPRGGNSRSGLGVRLSQGSGGRQCPPSHGLILRYLSSLPSHVLKNDHVKKFFSTAAPSPPLPGPSESVHEGLREGEFSGRL